VNAEPLNSARWAAVKAGAFHEAWFVAASDPKAGHGLWLRYGVDLKAGKPAGALWASWFRPRRTCPHLALGDHGEPAAIGRGEAVHLGNAWLSSESCSGAVEAGGHAIGLAALVRRRS